MVITTSPTTIGANVKLFDDPNGNHSRKNSAPNHTVHMKRLQAEHLLNSEPTDNFGFYKYNPEKNADDEVFDVVIPFMFQFAFVDTNRVLVTYIFCSFYHF